MKLREGTEKLFESIEIDGVQYNVYASLVTTLAMEWADRMEKCIEAGQTVAECAQQTMEMDTIGAGKWWYNAAITLLATTWIHGEALVDWNNAFYCATECPLKKEDHEEKPNEEEKVMNHGENVGSE